MISYLTPSTNLILGQELSSVLRNFGKDLARIGHKPDTHQLKLVEIKIELDKYFMFEFIFEISFSFLSAEKKGRSFQKEKRMRLKKVGLRLEILDSVGTKASLTEGSNSSTSISTDDEKR